MRSIFPKTLSGQLLVLLVIVLLVAQALNLLLLVDERRLQSDAAEYRQAIDRMAVQLVAIPDPVPAARDLPYELPNRNRAQGIFFLSINNRALIAAHARSLSQYETRLDRALRAAGVQPLSVSVAKRQHLGAKPPMGRNLKNEAIDLQDSRRGAYRRPPERREHPPRRERRDGVFHPEPVRGHAPPPPLRTEQSPHERHQNTDHTGRTSAPESAMEEIILSAEIRPGIWYNAIVPYAPVKAVTSRIILATAILLMLTLLAVWIFVRRISRPLAGLTRAADRLGRGDGGEHLDESGPDDIRLAAKAFNQMQERLTRMLDTQRTMLRAVGHDLRTPLTSLRIRAENIPRDAGRDKFIATIDAMTKMTSEILSWAKDASGTEPMEAVDINAMLESIADDYADQNLNVGFSPSEPLVIKCRRVAIKRALQNLIDNALKYGDQARISLKPDRHKVDIHVDDTGPGIPETQMHDVLQPFIRLESSRSKETGGSGLGLSITDNIVQAHGGALILENHAEGGLRATMRIPR